LRRERGNAFPWQNSLEEIDVVFHLAAQTSVATAAKNPPADFESNVRPLLQLAEVASENHWCPAVIFAGTVTEIGIPRRLPVNESYPDHPITIYDIHKWMAEQYLKYYARQRILRGATLRLANVYGPGPASQSQDRGVLNQMIRRALKGEILTLYGPGEQLRDFLYVEDASLAFLAAGTSIERINGRHFVIGTGKGHTLAEAFHLVADQVAQVTGRRVEVQKIQPSAPLLPIEERNFTADSRSFSEITGWSPRTSLSEGIAKTIQALR